MFTASNGAYRRTKFVIDWINIIIGVAVVIMATVIFIVPGKQDFLLPLVFLAGAGINGLHAAKNFLRFERKLGLLLSLGSIGLLAIAYCAAKILW